MSDNEGKPPDSENDAPPTDEDASPDDEDAAKSDDRAPDDDLGPVDGDDPSAPPLSPAVVKRFLNSKKAWDVAKAAIAKMVPAQEVEDLVVLAIQDASTAAPPHVEAALVSWLYKIAERRAADWLRKRKRRRKYEGAMPAQAAREDDYTGEAIEDDSDGGAQGYDPETDDAEDLLGDHLDRLVGDNAKDREVLEWFREHAGGKAYKTIGAERGYSEDQIASRIRRFKLKYEKPVRRRRQQMLLFWLGGGAVAVVVAAFAIWWLFFREPHSYYKPLPATSASPASTAEPEGFPVSHPPPPDDEDGGH